jgi:hypothetical protein
MEHGVGGCSLLLILFPNLEGLSLHSRDVVDDPSQHISTSSSRVATEYPQKSTFSGWTSLVRRHSSVPTDIVSRRRQRELNYVFLSRWLSCGQISSIFGYSGSGAACFVQMLYLFRLCVQLPSALQFRERQAKYRPTNFTISGNLMH